MDNNIPVRRSVRILLINEADEILLMYFDNPGIKTLEGDNPGIFWAPIGGGIEHGESIQDTAIRELFEETGLGREDIQLGPVVWLGQMELLLRDVPTRIDETFIVVKTGKFEVSLARLTPEEKDYVKKLEWFSVERIAKSKEAVYPSGLADLLPDIIADRYPEKPMQLYNFSKHTNRYS